MPIAPLAIALPNQKFSIINDLALEQAFGV
jgi:hypothetical protein